MISAADRGLAGLPARLAALPPSCGPVRLVAIDGHAGSGKSTLAGRLSRALGGAPVVRLDDLASHGAFFDWVEPLTRQVLRPLAAGRAARYGVYDWERRAFTTTAVAPAAPVVLLEGVGAGRRALRPHLAFLIWLSVPAGVAWARGRRRDGPELAGFWAEWEAAERAHFADDPSRPHADILITPRDGDYHARE
ncbi:uridine kinase family protein [Streptomyces sp. URMC 129]|uniref:uridine kinase family protein n=1 Tax=Streptomyces sp. URMC 129 TaxID=3423407 RepID=UPI003F1BA433